MKESSRRAVMETGVKGKRGTGERERIMLTDTEGRIHVSIYQNTQRLKTVQGCHGNQGGEIARRGKDEGRRPLGDERGARPRPRFWAQIRNGFLGGAKSLKPTHICRLASMLSC